MKCKLSEKCEFGNLCKDATRHDSLTVLGCLSFKTKKPMTNEYFLRTATTEQLAECITNISFNTGYDSYDVVYRKMVEWLKQPHRGE